ncbi:MAG TPA: LysR substrate-binding domain-containing protein [Streptosporangiaceae bacterium]|nr:LysR substrate-binding domain-containing protein [Streptosporangiaceae bacterium]
MTEAPIVTLNQLRTFLAVADSGSVRAAAEQLVVTQAAVSASLATLQKSLGVQLLCPDGRGLRLTPAGVAYAGYVRRAIGLLDEAPRAAATAADPERGELRIAAVTSAAEQIMPELLSGFRQLHPNVGVLLEAGNRDRVTALMDRHQVDLVLGGRPEPGRDAAVQAVRPHELVVVAAPALAGSAADPDLLAWLARQTWLQREPGSGTRATTEALFADLDIAPLILTLGSNGAIRESAGVGLGVTLVSRDAVAPELASGRLTELPVPGTPLHRDWYLVARPGPLPAPAAWMVAEALGAGGFHRPGAASAEAGRPAASRR